MAFKNSYTDYNKVLLEAIQDSQIDDENLEPQFVRIRSGNLGNFYIGSTNTQTIPVNPASIIVNPNSISTRKIRRLGVSAVLFSLRIPNVNPTNRTLSFYSSNTIGVKYTINLTENYYTTPAQLVTELITQLNTLTGSTGLTFSSIVNAIDNSVYTIASAGGDYYFDANSPLAKAVFLINLDTTQSFSSGKVIGPIQLVYTRYIDIISSELTKYDKNPSASTDSVYKAGNILRLFLFSGLSPSNPNPGGPYSNYYTYDNIRWINYNRTQALGPIDLQFYDEAGNYLYIPNFGNTNTYTTFWIKLIITTEL